MYFYLILVTAAVVTSTTAQQNQGFPNQPVGSNQWYPNNNGQTGFNGQLGNSQYPYGTQNGQYPYGTQNGQYPFGNQNGQYPYGNQPQNSYDPYNNMYPNQYGQGIYDQFGTRVTGLGQSQRGCRTQTRRICSEQVQCIMGQICCAKPRNVFQPQQQQGMSIIRPPQKSRPSGTFRILPDRLKNRHKEVDVLMPKREKTEATSDASDDDFASDDNPASVSQDELYGTSELSEPIKRRRVDFDSVRLMSVHGVNDISLKVQHVQLYKLSERLMLKDRLLNEEIKRNESYCMRQFQDDKKICLVNRYLSQLSDDLHAIVERVGPNTSMKEIKEEPAEQSQFISPEFLSDIEEKNAEELDTIWQKRVSTTLNVTQTIMDLIKAQSAELSAFARRLESALEKETEERTTELTSLVEAFKTSNEVATLTAANTKLTKEVQQYQQKCQNDSLEVARLQDEIMLKNTKIDELMQQIEDKQFELRKSWAKEAKLDHRLATMAKQQSIGGPEVFKNVSKTDVNMSAENLSDLEEAKKEISFEKEKSQARLKEIESLNDRLKHLSSQTELLRLKNFEFETNANEKSKEYNSLRDCYDELYHEHERVLEELASTNELIFEMEKKHEEGLNEYKQIEQMAMEKMHQHLNNQERELSKYKSDYEKLRIDIDKNVNESNRQLALQQDLATFIKALETQVHNFKQESARFKKKWQEAVKNSMQTKGQLERDKAYHEQCLLIPLPDGFTDGKTDSSKQKNGAIENEPMPTTMDELREYASRLRTRIDELRGFEDAAQNVTSEKRELLEVLAKEKSLVLQNERLIELVRRIHANEWQNDLKFQADDHKRKIGELKQQNSVLQIEATNAKADEEALMAEMESTGVALEQLQEQNGKLLKQIKEKDDLHLKMMSDRIEAALLESKLKDEKSTLLEKVELLENMVAAQSHEISQYKTLHTQTSTALDEKKNHFRKAIDRLDSIQAKWKDAHQKLTEEKGRVQTLTTQLTNYTEVVETKTQDNEKSISTIRRLKEEQDLLKKRLQHVKGAEQSVKDEVLLMEISDLKEQLTCPSCKVNRKDALLTKCYHVFCMKCIKTRYEMRRRKCPKCNACFGANDYHRIYIT
ncbi:unnamed protein product, partial [Mesorhabditis belari]|uniref:E3 ubiquitin protein ligase n=1 Tax=Mesorhabditis belari TaxID=2138241 RepID=A0AAF3FRS8_9BILA